MEFLKAFTSFKLICLVFLCTLVSTAFEEDEKQNANESLWSKGRGAIHNWAREHPEAVLATGVVLATAAAAGGIYGMTKLVGEPSRPKQGQDSYLSRPLLQSHLVDPFRGVRYFEETAAAGQHNRGSGVSYSNQDTMRWLSGVGTPHLVRHNTVPATAQTAGEANALPPHPDEITVPLPGLSFKINFQHYSGNPCIPRFWTLSALAGYLRASSTRFLHYWFVTSQNNPGTDPLVFWFNGGPGCSSVSGLLDEMGPYMVNADGQTLRKNPFAWNQRASVVYIESPAGVGFSYATNGDYKADDDSASLENYAALQSFFAKFPSFRGHHLFITGESYAGIYIPTLAQRILDGQHEFTLNLEGIAIGNGYMNVDLGDDTLVRFLYGHGLLDDEVWGELQKCCGGCTDKCFFPDDVSDSCYQNYVYGPIQNFYSNGPYNYDIYRVCGSGTVSKHERQMRKHVHSNLHKRSRMARLLLQSGLGQSNAAAVENSQCPNDSLDPEEIKYMNVPALRKALHIPDSLPAWDECTK